MAFSRSLLLRSSLGLPLASIAAPLVSANDLVDDLLHRAERQDLVLPNDLPSRFELGLRLEGLPVRLVLERVSLRGPDFQVLADDGSGPVAVEAGPVRSYRGTVRERPNAIVAASLLPSGLHAAILERDHPTWFVQPSTDLEPARAGCHLIHRHAEDWADRFRCGCQPLAESWDAARFRPATRAAAVRDRRGRGMLNAAPDPTGSGGWGGSGGGPGIRVGNCTKVCDVAWDADFEMFVQSGSTVAGTVAEITAVQNAVDAFYSRDALISYRLGTILVRTAEPDPYDLSGFDRLGEFVSEWNSNQGHVPRDLAHLASGHPSLAGSGVAYLGVVCHGSAGYGMSGFAGGFGSAVAVTGHEMGHNWSSPHCQDPSCVSMCGACEQLGERGTDVMMAHRDAVPCLDDGTLPLSPIPPRAREDEVILVDRRAVNLDVLANDLDANCDTLFIDSFDAQSEAGGQVELSPGTGPGGRDELRYTPPLDSFLGPDVFEYVCADGSGRSDLGRVVLLDPRADLVAHYKLDEKQGRRTCVDHSGADHDGRYEGGVIKRQAPAHPDTKYSVWFDGAGGRVEIPSTTTLHRLRHGVSVSAWVLPETGGTARIVSNPGLWSFGHSGSSLWFTVHGYDYTISDELIPAGLVVGEWNHVGAVFRPNDRVRFFVNGAFLGVREMGVPRRDAGGTWYLGSQGSDRHLQGRLDDVQIYEAELDSRQMQYLHDHPGATLCSESWTVYGDGHPGSLGVPAIEATGNIRLNDSFRVRYDNSRGTSTIGVLFFGFATNAAPLFGGTLLVDIFDLVVLPIPGTGGSLPLNVPDNPNACGLPVYFQMVEKDDGAAGGYSFTPGLQVEIGN